MKVDLRPGTRLSSSYSNRRDCYKVVEEGNVLGFVVSRGGPQSAPAIYPLWRADLHLKAGKIWHIVSSYEQGPRLNDYTFQADYEGCTFATIAAQAIAALEERHFVRDLATKRAAKTSAKKKKATRRKPPRSPK